VLSDNRIMYETFPGQRLNIRQSGYRNTHGVVAAETGCFWPWKNKKGA
jgi:hypothetical protein